MTRPPHDEWPALRAALDAATTPRVFFVRDDDAGWADERLFALLDTMRDADAPIDVAVIPQALGEPLAARLRARLDASGGQLGVHQHGYAHSNHEPSGRKGEFGAARPLAQRVADVAAGRERLRSAFGGRLDPIFTPPWNRCAPDLPGQLPALGIELLSRDATAPAQAALPELPVQVDWCRHWREAQGDTPAALAAIDADLADAVQGSAPAVGLMLHHAVMGDGELTRLRELMHMLARHRQAQVRPMRSCLQATALA